ncbi:cilia- and flagella-associated protein 418-like isoform X1 [Ostrea edulis]|uniref:cilia- and flagella-associated protein 418-like isoform X1 n=1 Tax=Ostrea edulis TaxID=37623 RepID=UPI0024AED457|nr:cilia- and flagella-associated protein 418-like isoform X1 [Ostrea edulis]
MAEDIDDLLEEVESKFLTKDNKKTKSKSNRKEKRDNDYDIDDILDDIQVEPIAKGSVPSAPNGTATDLRPASGRKCFPVYIGGALCSQGMASSVNQRSCDKLRCTSCDFKVCSFDNYEWHPDTDYLFLRNNAPDYHRLKTNLVPKRGSRSYCCQCCLRSVQEMTKLADPRLKWVCGKH